MASSQILLKSALFGRLFQSYNASSWKAVCLTQRLISPRRCLCSSSDGSSSDSSDSDADVPRKPRKDVNDLLSKKSGTQTGSTKEAKPKRSISELLAKPEEAKKREAREKLKAEVGAKGTDLDTKLVSAAVDAAKSLPGNRDKNISDLLAQIRRDQAPQRASWGRPQGQREGYGGKDGLRTNKGQRDRERRQGDREFGKRERWESKRQQMDRDRPPADRADPFSKDGLRARPEERTRESSPVDREKPAAKMDREPPQQRDREGLPTKRKELDAKEGVKVIDQSTEHKRVSRDREEFGPREGLRTRTQQRHGEQPFGDIPAAIPTQEVRLTQQARKREQRRPDEARPDYAGEGMRTRPQYRERGGPSELQPAENLMVKVERDDDRRKRDVSGEPQEVQTRPSSIFEGERLNIFEAVLETQPADHTQETEGDPETGTDVDPDRHTVTEIETEAGDETCSWSLSKSKPVPPPKSLFDVLEQEELEKLSSWVPTNAFEEQIRWTREGKMWKFPVDNELGLEEEQDVSFAEHVLLDDHLQDFPDVPSILHFMELVCVGLSKNAFMTAKEKREHIEWYKKYFKEKMSHFEDEISGEAVTVEQ